MINTGSGSYFLNNGVTAPQGLQMYAEDMISAAAAAAAAASSGSHTGDFLYNISLLKDKINQVQSLASFFISPNDQNLQQQPSYNYGSTAIAIASIGTLIQEIIVTATSVMYTCQQMNSVHNNNLSDGRLNTSSSGLWVNKDLINPDGVIERDPSAGFYMSESIDWCGTTDVNKTPTCITTTPNNSVLASRSNDISPSPRVCSSSNNIATNVRRNLPLKVEKNPEERVQEKMSSLVKNYDIVELNAADILAKYTHYCQVCGKGFKRDANLRMHMRAHGDEYKSSAALSNPLKNNNGGEDQQGKGHDHGVVPAEVPRKYSCPHEGCRWNKKHAKFQPLKSMICVKNHYKRSHCPKMYVCKRCNKKQFSVLSDLRTHEKHCGDLKWQCSCGTTFSRKDKLMGHVALFVGHTPAISSLAKMGNIVD